MVWNVNLLDFISCSFVDLLCLGTAAYIDQQKKYIFDTKADDNMEVCF